MKKGLSHLIFALLLFSLFTSAALALLSPDVTGDGRVDAQDTRAVLASWLSTVNQILDIDENGKVNSQDLAYVIRDFDKLLSSPIPTPLNSPSPLPSPTTIPVPPGEWTQHGHDAQRTSYTDQAVSTPWRWKWSWNGPNSTGGISAGKTGLPRNVQPITGGGRVYVAAGTRGVYALNQQDTNGDRLADVLWNATGIGTVNSTVAYDADTNSVFVVSTNGTLYKLNATSGAITSQFASTTGTSSLPLPPAVIADRVFFSMGTSVYAINKQTMNQLWRYDAGSSVHTPPAYSPSRNRVVVAGQDLFVHAVNNTDGTRAWRVKPTPRNGGDPGANSTTLAEVKNGWPVIAEIHGLVLVKLRLEWEALWTWGNWPTDNATTRSNLESRPDQQALMVLDLDDGSVPFIANIGHGSMGDGGYEPMGPQPVVKRFSDNQEIVYTVIRGETSGDGRWDSHPGEMMLDTTTVPGLQAGYIRWIDDHKFTNNMLFFPTDEQPNPTMAGDNLFFGHWEAGAAFRITDRSSARGTYTNSITTSVAPAFATSQDSTACAFSASHYCANGVTNTRGYPPGFYIYYGQGAVYDQYWNEYASWVVSNSSVYFVSTDGAIVALENGNP